MWLFRSLNSLSKPIHPFFTSFLLSSAKVSTRKDPVWHLIRSLNEKVCGPFSSVVRWRFGSQSRGWNFAGEIWKENDFSESLDSVYSKGLAKSSVFDRLGTKKAPVWHHQRAGRHSPHQEEIKEQHPVDVSSFACGSGQIWYWGPVDDGAAFLLLFLASSNGWKNHFTVSKGQEKQWSPMCFMNWWYCLCRLMFWIAWFPNVGPWII